MDWPKQSGLDGKTAVAVVVGTRPWPLADQRFDGVRNSFFGAAAWSWKFGCVCCCDVPRRVRMAGDPSGGQIGRHGFDLDPLHHGKDALVVVIVAHGCHRGIAKMAVDRHSQNSQVGVWHRHGQLEAGGVGNWA